MTPPQQEAMKQLQALGFEDLKFTGEKKVSGGTQLLYEADDGGPVLDGPAVFVDASGDVKLLPWTSFVGI